MFEEDEHDNDPCVARRPGCKFTDRIMDYLLWEWEVNVMDYPHEIQERIMDMVDLMAGKATVPAVAAKIAMEVLPI